MPHEELNTPDGIAKSSIFREFPISKRVLPYWQIAGGSLTNLVQSTPCTTRYAGKGHDRSATACSVWPKSKK